MAKYTIDIPKPCSEDWNQMTPLEKGRHCAVCEKTILDFSNYTKQELIQHIKREGKICGRVPAKYLNIELTESTANRGIGLRGLVAAIINLLVLTTATSAQAQVKNSVEQSEQQKGDSSDNIEVTVLPTQPLKRIVTGQIVDEEGLGLPGAAVYIEGTEYKTSSDFNGFFKLELSLDFDVSKNVILQYIGFEDQLLNVERLLASKNEVIIMKEFALGEVIVKKKKKWLFF